MSERFYTALIPRHTPEKGQTIGRIAVYPKEWAGVFSRCPKGMETRILNDEEGWLLGRFDEDAYIPNDKEMTIISKAEADKLMSQTQQAVNVFVGVQKIAERWAKQEAEQAKELADQQKVLFDAAIEKVINGI